MASASLLPRSISILSLRVAPGEPNPDWPDLHVLADERDLGSGEWRGFDPDDILGSAALLPVPGGRRVAVLRCSCGEPGCGALTVRIHGTDDGRNVVWTDPRDLSGVATGPLLNVVDGGRPLDLPDLRFDRDQYEAEVARATGDRTWETPRRRTARLVGEWLLPRAPTLAPDFALSFVGPSWTDDAVLICFDNRGSSQPFEQRFLLLTRCHEDPEHAAVDIRDRLRSTPTDRWLARWGWNPDRRSAGLRS